MVMHGTNEFTEEIFKKCVKRGLTRANVNQVVLEGYFRFIKEKTGKIPLTDLMEQGTRIAEERIGWLMDVLGSSGKG